MSIPAALLATSASADVLWDQIGSSTGENLTGDIYGSMHFLPEIPLTSDLAAVDAFTLEQHSTVDAVEFVLDGWSAFDGPADVTNWHVNIYSDLEAAASNLVGNILSQESMPIFVDEWSGDPRALEEGAAIGWFAHDGMAALDRPPLDVDLCEQIFAAGVASGASR